MFAMVDKDNSNCLSYSEFRDAFKFLTYGLNDNDINMLISMADEDQNEKINWHEFLETGIRMIKIIYARNQLKNGSTPNEPNTQALKMVYEREIKLITSLLKQRFMSYDKEKTG